MFHQHASRRSVIGSALGLAIASLTFSASAADFPGSEPIKLVVPFPPGGLTDVLSRLLAQGLAEELKGTVIVENVAGATGKLGMNKVAKAVADGRTLVMSLGTTHVMAPALYKDLPYKTDQDFVAIGGTGVSKLAVIANPKLQASGLQELLAIARKQEQPMIYGSWGTGSGGHLLMEVIQQYGKLAMTQAPYKGEAPMLNALMGGEILFGVSSVGAALPLIKDGRLKALGVTGTSRSGLLPSVPTLDEQGLKFAGSMGWFGLFAPAKTPAPVVEQLTTALTAVLARPQVQEKMRSLGLETQTSSRAEFERQIKEDLVYWRELVTKAKIEVPN
ncbi:MAG: ABC transporter substrate-binding protein [Ideonella sp. MAG2]|nr:MAG: ABC transporter substrate-binding protein [Ideonella sp. MAG2]